MKRAGFIVISYFIFGIVWIYFGDKMLFSLGVESKFIEALSNFKGYLFVVISTVLLFFAIRSSYKDILKKSNQIQVLFSNPDISLIQVSEEGRFLDLHDNFAKKLGYDREELVGKNTGDITHPEDQLEDTYKWDLFLQMQSNVYEREKRYKHKNGTYSWFQLIGTIVKDIQGSPYFIAVLTDISKSKEAEKKLANQLREKEVLINSTEDLIWSIDTEMRLQSFNDAYANTIKLWSGTAPEHGMELLSKSHLDDSSQFWLNGYLRALNKEQFSATIDQKIKQKTHFFKINFTPITHQSNVIGVACYAKDISEEYQIINALKEEVAKNK